MERAVYKKDDETALEYKRFADSVISYWERYGFSAKPNGYLLTQAPRTLLVSNSTIAPYIDQIQPDSDGLIHDVLLQRCVRMNSLGKETVLPNLEWTTSFVMGGIVTTESSLSQMIDQTVAFFTLEQKILRNRLQITVSPKDEISLEALGQANVSGIDIDYLDENEEKWVIWQFGIPGPRGQGITLSLKNDGGDDDGQFLNVIHIDEFTNESGGTAKLKKPVIDVGFGIERFVNLKNGIKPFEASLYLKIAEKISSNVSDMEPAQQLRVYTVADNVRTLGFMLDEDIKPDKKGQGYLVRRLARNIFLNLGLLGIQDSGLKISELFPSEHIAVLNQELNLYLKIISLADKEVSRIKPGKFNSIEEASIYLKDTHGIPEEISFSLLQKVFN